MMYVLEYLIYHLKPYGHNTVVKAACSNNSTKVDNSSTSSNKTKESKTVMTVNPNIPVPKTGSQAAGEREEKLVGNVQEDFVDNPETIDKSITVNIEEEARDQEVVEKVKKIQERLQKSMRKSETGEALKKSQDKPLSNTTSNPESKGVDKKEKLGNSKLLKALRRRKL